MVNSVFMVRLGLNGMVVSCSCLVIVVCIRLIMELMRNLVSRLMVMCYSLN